MKGRVALRRKRQREKYAGAACRHACKPLARPGCSSRQADMFMPIILYRYYFFQRQFLDISFLRPYKNREYQNRYRSDELTPFTIKPFGNQMLYSAVTILHQITLGVWMSMWHTKKQREKQHLVRRKSFTPRDSAKLTMKAPNWIAIAFIWCTAGSVSYGRWTTDHGEIQVGAHACG